MVGDHSVVADWHKTGVGVIGSSPESAIRIEPQLEVAVSHVKARPVARVKRDARARQPCPHAPGSIFPEAVRTIVTAQQDAEMLMSRTALTHEGSFRQTRAVSVIQRRRRW